MARFLCLMLCMTTSVFASDPPKIPAVTTAIRFAIDAKEVPGAVTAVVTKDRLIDLQGLGFADVESSKPMTPDSIFWIKSMTKPVTAVAVLMLQDEGKLNVEDKVAKYLPGFGDLKTPSGKAADLTIGQLLDHTSGLGEATRGGPPVRTLADLLPRILASPMQFEPGERWKYTQSGINMAAHLVEVVSGQPFDVFLEQRLFRPLGMKDTTFYPSGTQLDRVVTRYKKNKEAGALEAEPARTDLPDRTRPPTGNDGLYSTAPDFARFAQMLLNDGQLDGPRRTDDGRVGHPAGLRRLDGAGQQLVGDLGVPGGGDDAQGQAGRIHRLHDRRSGPAHEGCSSTRGETFSGIGSACAGGVSAGPASVSGSMMSSR